MLLDLMLGVLKEILMINLGMKRFFVFLFMVIVLVGQLVGGVGVLAGEGEAREVKNVKGKGEAKLNGLGGYREGKLLGWTVYVHRDLEADQVLYKGVMDEARSQLYRIVRVLPSDKVAILQRTKIWFGLKNPKVVCACYHPGKGWLKANGFLAKKVKGVDIGNARNFVNWTKEHQPAMLLHELAHAYHDGVLGYNDKEIAEAHQRAKASGKYEKVLKSNGRLGKHYGMNNPMEFFAESTEAMFGTNDFYPFVRAELRVFDVETYRLMRRIWGLDKVIVGENRKRGKWSREGLKRKEREKVKASVKKGENDKE